MEGILAPYLADSNIEDTHTHIHTAVPRKLAITVMIVKHVQPLGLPNMVLLWDAD